MDTLFPIPPLNFLLLSRQITCPACDSFNLRPLAYGYGMEGGCEVSSENLKLVCEDCGLRFFDNPEIDEYVGDSITEEFEEQYLMDEILLNDKTPSSHYTKSVALQYIRNEQNLAHLRLVLDDSLQSALTSHIRKIFQK